MKKILILVGKKGSGKDTTFNLIKDINPEAKRIAFADTLKEEVAKDLNISLEQLESNKEQYRTILQKYGDVCRKQDENYFIKSAIKKINDSKESLIVITDCRFYNEHQTLIKEFGEDNVFTLRLSKTKSLPFELDKDSHISEMQLEGIPYDYFLINDFTEYFRFEIKRIWDDFISDKFFENLY